LFGSGREGALVLHCVSCVQPYRWMKGGVSKARLLRKATNEHRQSHKKRGNFEYMPCVQNQREFLVKEGTSSAHVLF
jgi:hypothetical protein